MRARFTPAAIVLYIAVIASLTAVVTGVAAFNESSAITDFAHDLRDASVDACERQNDVRRELNVVSVELDRIITSALEVDRDAIERARERGTLSPAEEREIRAVEMAAEALGPVEQINCESEYPEK